MISTPPAAHADLPPPSNAEPSAASEYAYARDLIGLCVRAALRRRRLAAAIFLLGALTSVAAAILLPRVYVVKTKILAQRNLVMPSLGNPRRSVPSDADSPTGAAGDLILGRDNLIAIIKELDLVSRWGRERSPLLRLKDRLTSIISAPPSDEDRERALLGLLERELHVQADDSTIRISLAWSHPETAYQIVSTAERNFFERRNAADVAVIADTIGILAAEAERQRETVDSAFARVVALRQAGLVAPTPPLAAIPAPGVVPKPEPVRSRAAPAPPPAPAPETRIASSLAEKRRAIRSIEEPRQQRLAELNAQRSRLLLTYTAAHPAVLQVDAEIKAISVDPSVLIELRREEQELVAQLGETPPPEPARANPRAPVRADAGARPSVPGASVVVNASPREDEPELANAKAKLVVAMRRYEDLMDRIDSARIELYTAQAAFKYRYTVVEPPEIPRKATRPNAPLVAVLGLVLSTFLAIFAAAVKDLMSDRFVETWQVRRRLQIPLLAEVEKP